MGLTHVSSVELSARRTWDVPVGEEREGDIRRVGDDTEQGGKKGHLFEPQQDVQAPRRVVHVRLTQVQEVVRPATAPASTFGQASFGGLGVDETSSSFGRADWEDFFWCAG